VKRSPEVPQSVPSHENPNGFVPGWPEATNANFAILVALVTLFFLPIFLHPNKMMWASDLIRAHWECKQVQWRSLWVWGHLPIWDPTVFCGKSIVSDPLSGLFYPLTMLFWIIPAPHLFGFVLWAQVILGAWGMFLFARKKGCDACGAFFAAVAFSLAGKTGAHVFAGHLEFLATVLALPWMFWALEHVLRNPSFRTSALLGVITALAAFAGNVQMLYWNLLFAFCYMALWVFRECTEPNGRFPFRSLLFVCLGAAMFLLAAAPWWFPVVRQTLLLGARARGADFEFATQGSAQFFDLLRLIWPNAGVAAPQALASDATNGFFWETSSYPGVIALCLALTAPFTLKRGQGVIAFTALGVLALILTLGENSPYFWLAYKIIPGFSLFRCPGRMFFYVNFALAMLGGFMLTHGREARPRWLLPTVICLMFEGTLIGALVFLRTPEIQVRGLWLPVLITFPLAILGFLWNAGSLSENKWRIAVVICLVAELFIFWRPMVNVVDPRQALPHPSAAEFLQQKHKERDFRFYDPTGMIEQQVAAGYGLESITGYHSGVSGRYLDMYHKIWRKDNSNITEQEMHSPTEATCPTILDLFNTEYVIAFEQDLGPGYELAYQTPEYETQHRRNVFRKTNALPRAYLVASAQLPQNGLSALDSLCLIDPRKECIVEDDPIEGSAPFQEIASTRNAPGDLTLHVNTSAPGIAVLSESWHPDWAATDNGHPVTVRLVNYNMIGVPISPGEHELHIWYRPWDLWTGITIAILIWPVLIVMIISFAISHHNRNRNKNLLQSSSAAS
jgi:hypothetical protein